MCRSTIGRSPLFSDGRTDAHCIVVSVPSPVGKCIVLLCSAFLTRTSENEMAGSGDTQPTTIVYIYKTQQTAANKHKGAVNMWQTCQRNPSPIENENNWRTVSAWCIAKAKAQTTRWGKWGGEEGQYEVGRSKKRNRDEQQNQSTETNIQDDETMSNLG